MAKSNPHYQGKTLIPFTPEEGGARQLIIYPRDLNIVWGRDCRYWNAPKLKEAAELLQVSWLEVTGSVDNIDPDKAYEVGFELAFTADAFGWGSSPIFMMVKRGKQGKFAWKREILDSNQTEPCRFWSTLKEADEKTNQDPDSRKLYFGLYEVWSGKWKGGLRINKAYVKELPRKMDRNQHTADSRAQ
ncbi:protein PHLOEM PROTEIN 2-LIKE A9-like [Andrographis paniculata]|uniref:protein PHLOEM PROTEIN 2-LIKE A9-like n=1 Tax=Andrographis paniculata TaxID=175694 RepID=UPI0021E928C4|nr:protein PHLOEM PROTEIN 2-LIKE A9-like [Andrographis paniculata]